MNTKLLLEMINNEAKELENLLAILDRQHKALIKEELDAVEECTKEIEERCKGVAALEINRRRTFGNDSIKDLIKDLNDQELEEAYRRIKMVAHAANQQKDTNDVLIKQRLGYTARMLEMIKPQKREASTYNAYGKMKR